MIQDALFELPRPAGTSRARRGLPPDVPWLNQYPRFDLTTEERREHEAKCRDEGDDCLRWWCAYADEVYRLAGRESHLLQELVHAGGIAPDPDREEHARGYARRGWRPS